jgi:hypothetical protein
MPLRREVSRCEAKTCTSRRSSCSGVLLPLLWFLCALHHRSELRFDSPKSLAKLQALDPWRNIGKTVARSLPDKKEGKLPREQLLKLLLEEVRGVS